MMRTMPLSYTLCQAEQETFGFDHTELGAAVAEMWNLPQAVRDTIRHHHSLSYDTPYAKTIACVELANVMLSLNGLGSIDRPLPGLSPSVMQHLGLKRGDLEVHSEQMTEELEANKALIELVRSN